MHSHPLLQSASFAALLCGASVGFVSAQQVTPVNTDESPSANEEVVTLPEFTVSDTRTNEYVAAESVTGTRVATKLIDLPFTVNVITGEFLDDFGALEFREQTAYTSNVVGYETISTGYSVRGIDANVQLRNGFRRIGLIDKVGVERVEVIKGAAASIYGTVMPGGTVNIITKKPKTKPEQRFGFTVGAHNLHRAQASTTGPLGASGKLFYRVDVAADSTKYDIDYKKKTQATAVGSVMWKITPVTSLLVEYEYLKRNEIGNASVPSRRKVVDDPYFPILSAAETPYNFTRAQRTYTSYDGVATEIFDFNSQGPNTYAKRDIHTVTATFEHRFNSIFSMRSSANWFTRTLERQELSGRNYDPVSNSVDLAVPRLRPFDEGGAAWQTDFLAAWKTGPIKHMTLLTFDWQRQTEKPERWDSNTVSVNVTTPAGTNTRALPLAFPGASGLPSGATISGPVGSTYMMGDFPLIIRADRTLGIPVNNSDLRFISYHDDPTLYSLFQKEDNKLDLFGIFLSERMTFWDDRVTLLAGGRYDYERNHARNLVTGTSSKNTTTEPSYQVGLNIRVLPDLTAYVNSSRSFVPQFSTGVDEDGLPFDVPTETGECWEFGFKASMLDGRLTFTAAHFDLSRNNVTREAYREDGSIYNITTGKETSKGYELDFNWSITQSLQFFGGYGYTVAKIVDSSDAPSFEGRPTRRTPRNSFGFGSKYNVKTGPLKGAYATIGYKYSDKSLTAAPGRRTITTSSGDIQNLRMPNGRLIAPEFPEGAIIPRGTLVPGTTSYYSFSVDDGRDTLWNGSYQLFDASIGYRWKVARRFTHKVQLNVSNILDEKYTYGSAGHGPARGWMLTYDLTF
ncbi:TonB-dependent receptor [Termitidicoccus mucosus]|uniref:TonB-dependent receptor plug domain-containing protein n=1 Tax=Termitidicoccus mucosus TaxID=1184151 RepID=A0A178IE65_9BACT|nr:hypothetical protein AW736_23475 [Opitutaceae bacterium TSB47]